MKQKNSMKEKDMESIMGSLLRIGVMVSATLVILGGVLYLYKYGQTVPDYRTFKGEPESLKNLPEIFKGALEFHGRAAIQLGLLALIATPVARVIFSIIGFSMERDYIYVFISILVLGIICFSMIYGI